MVLYGSLWALGTAAISVLLWRECGWWAGVLSALVMGPHHAGPLSVPSYPVTASAAAVDERNSFPLMRNPCSRISSTYSRPLKVLVMRAGGEGRREAVFALLEQLGLQRTHVGLRPRVRPGPTACSAHADRVQCPGARP